LATMSFTDTSIHAARLYQQTVCHQSPTGQCSGHEWTPTWAAFLRWCTCQPSKRELEPKTGKPARVSTRRMGMGLVHFLG
jgi:hypothetical protein